MKQQQQSFAVLQLLQSLLILLIITCLTSADDTDDCHSLHKPTACKNDEAIAYEVTVLCINKTTAHVSYHPSFSSAGDISLVTIQYDCYNGKQRHTHAFAFQSESLEGTQTVSSELFTASGYCQINGCTKRDRKQCWMFIENPINFTCRSNSDETTSTSMPQESFQTVVPSTTAPPVLTDLETQSKRSMMSQHPSQTQTTSLLNQPAQSEDEAKLPLTTFNLLSKEPSKFIVTTSASQFFTARHQYLEHTTVLEVPPIVTESSSLYYTSILLEATAVIASLKATENIETPSELSMIILSISVSIGVLIVVSFISIIALVILCVGVRRLYKRVNSTSNCCEVNHEQNNCKNLCVESGI